jgi:transcriptional regulator with XRE-family HTH domain
MDNLSQNLKYLLLEKGVDRGKWVQHLSSLIQSGIERARSIINGDVVELHQEELKSLAQFSGREPGELLSENLLIIDDVDVFSKNLSFLIDRLPHGRKKHLAENLKVDQTTISRWRNRTQRPTKKKVLAILDYFNLPRSTDLEKEPLFLSTMPIGEDETKKWLIDKIEKLDREKLKELTPALIMLFKNK